MLEVGDKVLSGIAAEIANARTDLDKITHNLESQLAPMKTQFQGQAGAAFQNLHAAWSQRQRTITRALDDFEASLYASEQANNAQDEAQLASMTALANRLG